jgi:predicted dehydrogenase
MHLGLQKIPPDAMLPGASSAAPLVRVGHILQGGSTSVPSATGSAEKLRVGIIGCGAGMFHLDGYSEEPRAEVVALAGLDTERCQKLAAQYAIPSIYREYQELLARDDIDVVSIAVPNNLHLPMALAAFESGKHVLVEKPIARTAAEGEQMVAAAKKAGKLLGVAFNRRARHDVQLVHKAVSAGEFGRVYYAKAFWMRRSGIPGMGSWFTKKEGAGGGPLIDLGVHVLDMALYMMGNPKITAVSAATYAELGPQGRGAWRGARFLVDTDQPYEVEDLATALIRMEDGATLQLETAWAAYTGAGDDFGVSLFGSNGGAEIVAKDYALTGTLRVFGEFAGIPTDSSPRLQKTNGHAEIIKAFVTSILDGTPVSPSGEEGIDRARLIDAIYHSADLGREVRIEELSAVSRLPSATTP